MKIIKSRRQIYKRLKAGKEIADVLNKAKTQALSKKDVAFVLKELPESESKNKLLSVLLPEAETWMQKAFFPEIGRLSLLGAIPVVGGILGGITADKVTNTASKKSTQTKLKRAFINILPISSFVTSEPVPHCLRQKGSKNPK